MIILVLLVSTEQVRYNGNRYQIIAIIDIHTYISVFQYINRNTDSSHALNLLTFYYTPSSTCSYSSHSSYFSHYLHTHTHPLPQHPYTHTLPCPPDLTCPVGTIYNDLNLSTVDASLVTSLLFLGGLCGALFGSYPSTWYGRRKALFFHNFFVIAGQLLAASGNLVSEQHYTSCTNHALFIARSFVLEHIYIYTYIYLAYETFVLSTAYHYLLLQLYR